MLSIPERVEDRKWLLSESEHMQHTEKGKLGQGAKTENEQLHRNTGTSSPPPAQPKLQSVVEFLLNFSLLKCSGLESPACPVAASVPTSQLRSTCHLNFSPARGNSGISTRLLWGRVRSQRERR